MGNITIKKIRDTMLCINVTACLFIMLVIFKTSRTICIFQQAVDFFNSIEKIPVKPDSTFILSILICAGFIITHCIRQLVFINNKVSVYITLSIDILLNICLLRITDCNYNGFILWLLANCIYYVENKRKYFAMIAGIFLFVFSSHDLITIYYPLFSIRNYISFYSKITQNILLFIYYGLSSVNLICFLLFCINVIQEQRGIIAVIHRLYKKLRIANTKLKEYADIKEKMGQIKERNRLTMEIHDTLGHSLTGISVGVDTCIAVMDKYPEKAKAQLQVISSVAKDGIKDIRRSISMLKTDELDCVDFEDTVRNMLEKIKKATGIKIIFVCNANLNPSEDEQNAVFRVIQESVTNAIRHGKAARIIITLVEKNSNLDITISDNGRGCSQLKYGFGLSHMQERIKMLNGTIEFKSDSGFTVHALIPVREKTQNDKNFNC
ncbi:MAG: sensor histidine kinase [Treponema sp.]